MMANLRWVRTDAGGRRTLPYQSPYSTLVTFSDQNTPGIHESWSLIVDFIDVPSWNRDQKVSVRFLSEAAPTYLLREGASFTLWEGSKAVAEGTIPVRS